MFDGICEAIHKEMDTLEEKYEKGTQLSGQDLDHIDKMAHALKSLKTYEAMCCGGDTESSYAKVRRGGRYDREDGYYRRY